MKAFSVVLLISVCAFASAANVRVVLVIGQSNSIGYNSGGHTNEDTGSTQIKQVSCCVNGQVNNDQCKIVDGQDPLHHQCDDGYLQSQNIGFGMSFARQLLTDVPQGDVILLVPAGIGGTGFVDNVWTAYTGGGFVQALTRLRAAFTLAAAQYPGSPAVFQAILWHQGEADADVDTSTSDYLNKDIIPMINAWRDTNLIPQSGVTVPFVLGNLVPTWVEDPTQTKRLGVFTALQVLNQFIPYTATTPSQGLKGDIGEAPNPIHFSAPSQRLFGKRYFAAYKLAQANGLDTSA